METPKLSVVIASHNTRSVIAECLAALEGQKAREMAEIVVADSSSDGTADLVCERFPSVRLLHFSEPLSVPQLRGQGIMAAHGEKIIAILDPYCIVTDEWLTELLRLHAERPELVIGGAVELENGNEQNLASWVIYFSEYLAFMLPLEEGPATELTGNNIAYKRQALGEAVKPTGFWKTFFNRRLQADGHQLWAAPSLLVKLRKAIPLTDFFRSRYHHGRCFAAMRVNDAPYYSRWLRALTVPLLPYLGLWRQMRSLWPKRRHRLKFVKTVPILFLFHCGWAWGELWGYLRGPGQSCGQLYY
jgi:glycosyltransferase involved in cell wall biosynthesis